MLLVVYGSLTLAIGAPFRPPGPMWALSVLWVCSHAAGFVASRVGRPICPSRGPFFCSAADCACFWPSPSSLRSCHVTLQLCSRP